jgi:hypothetical protein
VRTVPTRTTVFTAQEYAKSLIPHLDHESYRCDDPEARLMGKGCKACGVEVLISIPHFQANGNLEAYEKEMKPHVKKGKK